MKVDEAEKENRLHNHLLSKVLEGGKGKEEKAMADVKEYEALIRRLKTLSLAQTIFLKVNRESSMLRGLLCHSSAIFMLTSHAIALNETKVIALW